ncbi:MAG: Crp/Fnr family transcriptional regulator [Bauldia sp.]|nr:Crp/Fnr family transcriptional regulator [Bauldia sp.]
MNGPPGGMFGIASGYVSVVANAGRFEPVLIYIGGPGLWAGEAAAVGKTERRVELMARTRVKALQLPAFELERIGSEDAALWRRLHGLTASHFDNALMFAFTLKRGNPRQKIAATLVRLAGSAAEDDDVTVPCSQTELGELAGLSRSTVGPALKALEANGLVRVGYGRITYRPRRLRDET